MYFGLLILSLNVVLFFVVVFFRGPEHDGSKGFQATR